MNRSQQCCASGVLILAPFLLFFGTFTICMIWMFCLKVKPEYIGLGTGALSVILAALLWASLPALRRINGFVGLALVSLAAFFEALSLMIYLSSTSSAWGVPAVAVGAADLVLYWITVCVFAARYSKKPEAQAQSLTGLNNLQIVAGVVVYPVRRPDLAESARPALPAGAAVQRVIACSVNDPAQTGARR